VLDVVVDVSHNSNLWLATAAGIASHEIPGSVGVTQREVEIVVGMVLALVGIVLILGGWPNAPAREMVGVWGIDALSLALWRILIRGDK
jgi:hypothetical protein